MFAVEPSQALGKHQSSVALPRCLVAKGFNHGLLFARWVGQQRRDCSFPATAYEGWEEKRKCILIDWRG
jgi:hypothetical protein